MSIERAIEKAIERGWRPPNHREIFEYNPNNRTGVHTSVRASLTHLEIFQDPLFWQSLGKALGWEKIHYGVKPENGYNGDPSNAVRHEKAWLYHWHRFIDHLAKGKPVESFFESL